MKLLMWREILMKLMTKCKLMFTCLANTNTFIINISNICGEQLWKRWELFIWTFCFSFKLFRNRWKEINDLEIKKEEIMQKKTSEDIVKEHSDDEDVEDEDLEDFMDWRSKTLKWISYCLWKSFKKS